MSALKRPVPSPMDANPIRRHPGCGSRDGSGVRTANGWSLICVSSGRWSAGEQHGTIEGRPAHCTGVTTRVVAPRALRWWRRAAIAIRAAVAGRSWLIGGRSIASKCSTVAVSASPDSGVRHVGLGRIRAEGIREGLPIAPDGDHDGEFVGSIRSPSDVRRYEARDAAWIRGSPVRG